MLIQDRVKLIIKVNQETPSSFAAKIGVNRSSLSHVLSGRNKPSLDFLEKIIRSYPKVNASWLVTGEAKKDIESPEPLVVKSKEESMPVDLEQGVVSDALQNSSEIERIVIFYKDGKFKEYQSS